VNPGAYCFVTSNHAMVETVLPSLAL